MDDGRVRSDNDSIPASSSSHENNDAHFPDFSPVPLLPAMSEYYYSKECIIVKSTGEYFFDDFVVPHERESQSSSK